MLRPEPVDFGQEGLVVRPRGDGEQERMTLRRLKLVSLVKIQLRLGVEREDHAHWLTSLMALVVYRAMEDERRGLASSKLVVTDKQVDLSA